MSDADRLGEHSQATRYALRGTATSEVIAADKTATVGSCPHATLPLQQWSNYRGPGPLLVFKVEASSPGLPTSVEKRDSAFGSDGSRQITGLSAPT